MKTTTYQCDLCRTVLPLAELIPIHFEVMKGRDKLVRAKTDLFNCQRHICANCLKDISEIEKEKESE